MFWPCETRTSTCRNFATISSGLYRFLVITVLLDVKDIPQVGPLQWGRIIWIPRLPRHHPSSRGTLRWRISLIASAGALPRSMAMTPKSAVFAERRRTSQMSLRSSQISLDQVSIRWRARLSARWGRRLAGEPRAVSPVPDHIFHRYRCHFGLAVVWRCSQSDACKLVAAAWLVGATNSTPGTDHSQHGGAARSRYCFIRSATAYGSSRLHAPERGSARSPTRGWPATSGAQHRQAPRRRAEDPSEALGNSAEALGNSARGDRCTGAQTDPGNGASVTFSVSISFRTTALRPTAHDFPKTRTPPEREKGRGLGNPQMWANYCYEGSAS